MNLILATNNAHKVAEIRSIMTGAGNIRLLTLREAGIEQEIPEPFDTLKANAQVKAQTIYRFSGEKSCFSEDTGLEVDALHGAPGVHSARYSGEPVSAERNIDKLLQALAGSETRAARFRTVVCLLLDGAEHYFEGVCEGEILVSRQGDGGFGYDAVFAPSGSRRSFAEMTTDEKNLVSHRRKAIHQLIQFLKNQGATS